MASWSNRAAAIAARVLVVAVFLMVVHPAPSAQQVIQWRSMGDQAMLAGDYRVAFDVYSRALSYVAPQPALWEHLVRVSVEAGLYDDARVYLYVLADQDGWNAARRDQLAAILTHSGEDVYASALLYVSAANDPRELRALAQEQIARLDWPNAETTLAQLLTLDATDAQSAYQLGLLLAPQAPDLARDYLLRAEHDPAYTVAARAVTQALDAYGTQSRTDALTYLGITLVGLGEWPFAEQALQMALEANAVNPAALAYLGFVRDQQGGDGLPDIEAALAMSPNDPLLYYILGQHWRLVQEHRQAYDAFTRAYWLAPENPALAAEVGTELQNMSDFVGAEQWLTRAVELAPQDVEWVRLLAAFYADTGFQLEAVGLDVIERAAGQFPADADIRASVGWAYYQTGDTERAYQELNTAVSQNPDQPRSRYYFGVVLERQGDLDGASDSYWFVVDTLGPDEGFGLLAARALRRLGSG
ncbi:MAG: tetratricopeptide repeat protein [Anaerolineae bacterium]|nr:tetratricopeptide repeat protein [Anaerolineae bacterium]